MAEVIYAYTDYKKFIKDRIKFIKKKKPHFSMHYLSDKLDIQYTFLSKILNSDTHHLSEDHLFKTSEIFELLSDETDFLFLLKSFQSTQSSNRKLFLEKKISAIQKSNLLSVNLAKSNTSYFADEMSYLMDYFASVVHVSLGINGIKSNPDLLSHYLRIDTEKLKILLDLLDRLGLIEYNKKSNEIKKINNLKLHYGKDHPLTRTHQIVMKSHLNQNSFIRAEQEKENLFYTFTTDKVGFDKIKKSIHRFVKEVQSITIEHQHTGVYQLNIDFVELFNSK